MNRIGIILILCVLFSSTRAQKTADQYFNQIPPPPSAPCESSELGNGEFKDKVNVLLDELKKDIDYRHQKSAKYMKEHEDIARKNAVANSGLVLTPDQKKKLEQKNKHMTETQKAELADEVMQQNMNVSLAELKKLRNEDNKVDKKAAENWAKAYSTELESQREVDPEKAEADQIRNSDLFYLQTQLNDELMQLNAGMAEFTERLSKLQEEADTAYSRLRMETNPKQAYIDTIESQLSREKKQCGCSMEERSKEVFEEVNLLMKQIQLLEYQYCLPLTPQYLAILEDYKLFIMKEFGRCDRIEKLQEEMQFRQIGVRDPEFKPGLLAVQSVRDYVVLLSNVYKFKISENPYQE